MIKRQDPDVEAVEFDDDGEHVYIAKRGEGIVLRYVMNATAQAFLVGEHGDGAGLRMNLLSPKKDEEEPP